MKEPRWILAAFTIFLLVGCVDPELGTDTDAQNVTNSEPSGVALKWNEGNWNETDWK